MQKAIERQVEELVHQRRLGTMPALVARVESDAVELENVGERLGGRYRNPTNNS